MSLELVATSDVKGFSYNPESKLTHVVREDASPFHDAMKGGLQCMTTVDTSRGFNRDQVESYTATVRNAARDFLRKFLPGNPRVTIVEVSIPGGTDYQYEGRIDLILSHPISEPDPSGDLPLPETEVLPVSELVAPVRGNDYTPVMRVGVYGDELVMDGRLRFGHNPVVNDALRLSRGIRLGGLQASKGLELCTVSDYVPKGNGGTGSHSLRIFPAYELLDAAREAWNVILFFANNGKVYQPLIEMWDKKSMMECEQGSVDSLKPYTNQDLAEANKAYWSMLAQAFVSKQE